jgi:lipoprotein-releasing system ATP-binding protein
VFQLPYLISELTVVENVMVKGLIQKQDINEATQQALALLARVGLEEKAYASPASLSGGQQQRVALARALFNKPTFLIADEPTGNVDTNTGNLILDLLFDAQKEWNMGIIISTHDEYVAQRMGKVLHMKDGVLIKV